MKKGKARETGMTLIAIPCWWDGSIEGLIGTIHFERQELMKSSELPPISLNPRPDYFTPADLPGVGELMLASFPQDTKFGWSISSHTWWIGEKYDGISRHGRELYLPKNILSCFPSIFVDSELWFGRGNFASTYALISSSTDTHALIFLRAISFDIPSVNFQQSPFEDRFNFLLSNIRKDSPFLTVPPRLLCNGSVHLNRSVQTIIDEEGEGVILQKCGSMYENGRTSALVKIKAVQGDAEAIVVGISADKSVSLQLPHGNIFTVPPTEVYIPTPLVGDVVTFSYEGHARRDLPVNPKVMRRRDDLEWGDVLRNTRQQNLNDSSYVKGFATRPLGYWTTKTMRAFLETFAKNRNMDPLLPSTWYTSYSSFCRTKGGKAVLRKFNGYIHALRSLLHEVQFNNSDFLRSYWRSIGNRRQFFELYAKQIGFNWWNPEIWYQQSNERIMSFKGAKRLVAYHNNSISKALVDLFPDIGLNLENLDSAQSKGDLSIRRQFFENYALNHKFDPLNPENWYSQSKDSIISAKGAGDVMIYYGGNVANALTNLFHDIGLDISKLPGNQSWRDVRKRREFFEKYARDNLFDPYKADHWYSQTKEMILAAKGASGIIMHHNHSVAQALLDLFPDIGLDKSKLRMSHSWRDVNDRRRFFERYAETHQFDYRDPERWYLQRKESILSTKGASGMLVHHNNSVVDALIELFPDIKFDKSKLSTSYSPLRDIANRRKLFEDYAISKRFDARSPESWYAQPTEELLSWKGLKTAIQYHSGRISRALSDLFPNIGLDESKFGYIKPMWSTVTSRRKFLEDFAKSNSFHPLNPQAWYTTAKNVHNAKGAGKVLLYHKGSVAQAVVDLFPELKLEKSKFNGLHNVLPKEIKGPP